MIDILSVASMRESDAATIAAGTPGRELMARAGKALFDTCPWKPPVAIVCGKGNNGGDGYALAPLLADQGIDLRLIVQEEPATPDARWFYDQCRLRNLPMASWEETFALGDYSTVVDCIFGTGFKGAARGIAAEVIKEINASGCEVVSVDINSGLGGDNGLIGGEYPAAEGAVCVESDLTVSVGGVKPGHFLGSAKDVMKRKINCDIGIAPVEPPYRLLTREDAAAAIPRRLNLSNKGTYGYVILIGGSARYSGAIRLAYLAEAALRSGAGVATVAVPAGIAPLITSHVLESTILPLPEAGGEIAFDSNALSRIAERSAVITFGMGVGTGEGAERSLSWLLENYNGRLIVDADGLTLLARMPEGALAGAKPAIVLTPHVKEFSRLLGSVPVSDIMAAPIAFAQRYAARYPAVTLLLKGPTTVVTDGGRVYLTDAGCPGMATAGSGDVLSGVLTAMAACIPDLTLAAAVGARGTRRAGVAAQRALGPASMLAGDTAARLPEVFTSLTGGND